MGCVKGCAGSDGFPEMVWSLLPELVWILFPEMVWGCFRCQGYCWLVLADGWRFEEAKVERWTCVVKNVECIRWCVEEEIRVRGEINLCLTYDASLAAMPAPWIVRIP